ncbi:MAG: tyrosine-type recombinase/integrase [Thermoguttaceae bacterium]|jgi:integrase/recombinase XerD|nr:tyrosine-type recombinase/integrase [Thermoguttaceae bacterium]
MTFYARHRQPPQSWVGYVDGWVMDMQARGLSEHTIEANWYRLTCFARTQTRGPDEVEPSDVQAWLTGERIEASTKAGRRASVNEFYKWGLRMKRLKANPVDALPPVKRPRKPARQPAPEQAVAKGLESDDADARLMVQLDAEAGLRREEICRVKGSDIVAYPQSGDEEISGLVVHGKGGKTRLVPICAQLADDIRDAAGDGWLFPGRYSGHCCVDHVYRVVRRATGYPTHSLRRRYGRIAYEASGYDLRAVQELLGHESPATTQSYIFVPQSSLGTIALKVKDRRPV